jgi:hypothetical protein
MAATFWNERLPPPVLHQPYGKGQEETAGTHQLARPRALGEPHGALDARYPAGGDRLPLHANPVLAAIERHSEAWAVLRVARLGADSERADDKAHAALMVMLGTACITRAGAFCLIQHLRWWLMEEAPNAGGYSDAWAIARAREADLSKLLGVEPIGRRLYNSARRARRYDFDLRNRLRRLSAM